MREKKPFLIITFSATVDAMAMEKYCMDHQLPGRLIPIPREIHAGCGLAWKTAPDERDLLICALKEADIRWEAMEILDMWS